MTGSTKFWLVLALACTAFAPWGCNDEGAPVEQPQEQQDRQETQGKAEDAAGKVKCSPLHPQAPTFSLLDLGGKEVSLEEELKTRVVLLVFWATWCPYCVAEIPDLNRMEKEHGEKVAILAIDIQESQAKVASFAKRKGIAYRVLLDFKADVARLYNIVGTPTLVLIDEAGCIQYKGHDIRQARTELLRLLEGKSE